ncbi:acetoin biosynthesis transcriptional regulator AlsR, partial [Bacillus rhizoplanae]|uniref:acetoin biosynthesis transcriptional regulator AlsR n=1 Tax=Bacillus rhizoplanae TaxID=2880966 RepID=UPI003D1CC8DE
MELRHLQYFIVVAEELHFGRAAARLQMTQPPLSQQIQQLEQEMGVTLFSRTKRRVELTEAGELFLKEVKKAFTQIEKAVEVAQRAQRGEIGSLSIGFVGSAMYDILPPIVREYRNKFPNVSVVLHELSTPEQVEALHDNRIDVGMLRPPITSQLLQLETVQHLPCTLCLPKAHPLASKQAIYIEDLQKESFVFISRNVWPTLYDNILSLCRDAGFSPQIVQEATEYQTVVGLVAAGIGITVIPVSANKLYQSEVVYKEICDSNFVAELAVAYRKANINPELQEFLKIAKARRMNLSRTNG